jgi:hypothetical protein
MADPIPPPAIQCRGCIGERLSNGIGNSAQLADFYLPWNADQHPHLSASPIAQGGETPIARAQRNRVYLDPGGAAFRDK